MESNFDPTSQKVIDIGTGFTEMLDSIEAIKGERYVALCRISFGMYNYMQSVHHTLNTIANRDNNEQLLAASAALELAINGVCADLYSQLMDVIINKDLNMDRTAAPYKEELKKLHDSWSKDMLALYTQQEKLGGKFFPSGNIEQYKDGEQG